MEEKEIGGAEVNDFSHGPQTADLHRSSLILLQLIYTHTI